MVLSKPKLTAQQRLDLEDLTVLFSGLLSDDKYRTKQFWSSTQYIFKGFTVSGLGGTSPASVSLTDATLVNANNSGAFSWYTAQSGAAPISVALNSNVRNYLELSLSTVDGTPLTKAFWDPSANGGLGAEFNQTVNTVTNLNISVVVLTSGFSGSADRIPLAIVDTDSGNNIKLILDKRPLFWRLGSTADGTSGYTWASQTEPELTLALTAVTGTFVAGETVTIGAQTAKVTSGGTTTIGVINLSADTISSGASVTGGTSSATGTLNTALSAFTGADKSIGSLKDMLSALMNEIRSVKGTDFWFEAGFGSIKGLESLVNACIVPNSAGAKVSWNGSALSITDSSGAPADADVIAKVRIFSRTQNLNLTREDGTGSSSTIALSDGDVLYIDAPVTGDRTYSGTGSGSTNFKKISRTLFTLKDTNFWLAYREGTNLIFRGVGKLASGESSQIGGGGALRGSTGATDSRVLKSSGTAGDTLQASGIELDSSNNIGSATSLAVGGTIAAKDASALVSMVSTSQGMLPPAMTSVQRNAISTPATGLSIYNLTTKLFEWYNGSAWVASPYDVGSSSDIRNHSLTASVASSALTINLIAQSNGGTPTATDPVLLAFRNSTSTSGIFNRFSVTGATSIVIPSGATLGHASSANHYIYVYAMFDGSTAVLAVSSAFFDDGSVQSSTAISSSATLNRVLYSTIAQTNKPCRLIGRMLSNQTVAGTWAAVPTEISLPPIVKIPVTSRHFTQAGQSIPNGATTVVNFGTISHDSHNAVTVGAGWSWVAPETRKYRVSAVINWATASFTNTNSMNLWVFVDGSVYTILERKFITATGNQRQTLQGSTEVSLSSGHSIDIRVAHDETTARALTGNAEDNVVTISSIG